MQLGEQNRLRGLTNKLVLPFIVAFAFWLRVYHIDFQSFWLDELYTLKEADPRISWSETLRLVLAYEQHPPPYFLLQKVALTLFGYTTFVARFVSLVGGVLGVVAIYYLGKELINRRVGIIAALFTSVNYFHIFYSQEARVYTFFFLCTVVSFYSLVRLLKEPSIKRSLYYALAALSLFYTHPFSVFVIIAQVIIIIMALLNSSQNTAVRLKYFVISCVAVFAGSIPMLKKLWSGTSIAATWIPMPAPDFMTGYFLEYFGNSDLLNPFLIVMAVLFVAHLTKEENVTTSVTGSKINFSFFIFLVWIVITYMIPFLWSKLVIPVMVSRYTVSAVPAFLLILAIGVGLLQNALLRNTLVVLFVMMSFIELFYIREYYHKPAKSQFRDVTSFVASIKSPGTSFFVNESANWQQSFYLEKEGIKNYTLYTDKDKLIDSIVRVKQKGGQLNDFWISGVHQQSRLSATAVTALDSLFLLSRSADFIDGWARHYIVKPSNFATHVNHHRFRSNLIGVVNADTVITIWDFYQRISDSIAMPEGNYEMKLLSKGVSFNNIYPHLRVWVSNTEIGQTEPGPEYTLSGGFKFSVGKESRLLIRLVMDNDTSTFRDAFVKDIYIFKD